MGFRFDIDSITPASSGGGGGSSQIESLNVTPTTSAQTITAPSGVDGYNPINVDAVTSAIDSNIIAENIKKDVPILGVVGTLESGGGSGVGITREVKNGKYQMPAENFTFSLPSNVTDIDDYGLYYVFYFCNSLTKINLSSLVTISGLSGLSYAFGFCKKLTEANLSALTTISNENGLSNAFRNCTSLTNVNLSSLTTVSNAYGLAATFQGCSALTNMHFSALTTISWSYVLRGIFTGCTALTDVYFNALTTNSFGTFNNQFSSMMTSTGTTVIHTLHFPSNLQSTISNLSGYPLFGGTSGYVICAFDLDPTE